MKSQIKKDLDGEYDIILGLPVAADFDKGAKRTNQFAEKRAKSYDLSERMLISQVKKRIIATATGSDAIRYHGDSHLMTIAPTGSGKGRSVIIPNLLHYRGPVIVVDPKGENYAVTHRRRREMGHKVIRLDPFRIMGSKSDSLNPFDIFQLHNFDVETDSQMLADLLSGDVANLKEPFWDNNARALISGVITYLAFHQGIIDNNIPSIGRHLMGKDPIADTEAILDSVKDMNSLAYMELSSFINLADVTRTGILSTANSYLKSFISQRVSETLETSSFSLKEIVDGDAITIYIIIPPDKLRSHKSILKLWIGTLLKAISTRRMRPKYNTLFMLDECGQLGHFQFLETAITLFRGYGLQTWTFWQDLSQLKKLYEMEWSTMVNNCAVLQIFGTKNYRVANEFAEMVGVEPEQISEVRPEEQVLFVNGEDLLKTKRFDYLKNSYFENKYDPNPLYDSPL